MVTQSNVKRRPKYRKIKSASRFCGSLFLQKNKSDTSQGQKPKMMCPTFLFMICRGHSRMPRGRFVNRPYEALYCKNYLQTSSIATATATVIPTIGLLPAPDNRHRASLQACLQASRGRLLRERCARRNKVQSTKKQAKRSCLSEQGV